MLQAIYPLALIRATIRIPESSSTMILAVKNLASVLSTISFLHYLPWRISCLHLLPRIISRQQQVTSVSIGVSITLDRIIIICDMSICSVSLTRFVVGQHSLQDN